MSALSLIFVKPLVQGPAWPVPEGTAMLAGSTGKHITQAGGW